MVVRLTNGGRGNADFKVTSGANLILGTYAEDVGCAWLQIVNSNLIIFNQRQSIDQPTNQPINQSTNQSPNQSINQLINQPNNRSINQPIDQSIKGASIKDVPTQGGHHNGDIWGKGRGKS